MVTVVSAETSSKVEGNRMRACTTGTAERRGLTRTTHRDLRAGAGDPLPGLLPRRLGDLADHEGLRPAVGRFKWARRQSMLLDAGRRTSRSPVSVVYVDARACSILPGRTTPRRSHAVIRFSISVEIDSRHGTGKTTLLRILANSIPDNERILVIEDTPELQIRKPNIVAAGAQTSTYNTNVSFDELLKDTLRFRPDRIILGEVRGIEARTLLDSFNTGHAGSLATIHANSAEKALRRFANLVMRSHAQTTFSDTEAEIGEAVDFVIHVERQDGRRIIREVLALRGYDRDAKRFLIEPVFEVQRAEPSPVAHPKIA